MPLRDPKPDKLASDESSEENGFEESGLSRDKYTRAENHELLSHKNKAAEELRRIEEIRREFETKKQLQSQQQKEISVIKNPTETVTVRGQQYTVEYVPKEEIYPAFGHGGGDKAVVRQDLSPRIKRFVKKHELYHCQDRAVWGGWLGREIRANVTSGLKDPVGLLATTWATISDFERIKFYLRRIKEGR